MLGTGAERLLCWGLTPNTKGSAHHAFLDWKVKDKWSDPVGCQGLIPKWDTNIKILYIYASVTTLLVSDLGAELDHFICLWLLGCPAALYDHYFQPTSDGNILETVCLIYLKLSQILTNMHGPNLWKFQVNQTNRFWDILKKEFFFNNPLFSFIYLKMLY